MRPSEEALSRLSADILSDSAFLLTEPSDNSLPLPMSSLSAVISIRAVASGARASLVLSAPRELATVIAADMLGVSIVDPDVAAHTEGALGELVNVLAGAVSEAVFGPRETCDLGVPRVLRGTHWVAASAGACSVTRSTDGGHLIRVDWLEAPKEKP
jgi:CheY-specific phosphatase CheX